MSFLLNSLSKTFTNTTRHFSGVKKFYKNASIVKANGGYEINLDQRKMKTPSGNLLKFPTESLAHAVSFEWNCNKDTVNLHNMPLTMISYAACDIPLQRTADVIADSCLKYLITDTVLYHALDPLSVSYMEELTKLQDEKWGGIVKWFNERFASDIKHTYGFGKPHISEETYSTLRYHLKSYDQWSMIAFERMVNNLKSVILSLALLDRHISAVEAVELSLLEQRFQVSKWGNVEWHHDVDYHETLMNVSACAIFIQFSNEYSNTIQLRSSAKF